MKRIVYVFTLILSMFSAYTVLNHLAHASGISTSSSQHVKKLITTQTSDMFGAKPAKITFTYNKHHTKLKTATVKFSDATYESSKLLQTSDAFYDLSEKNAKNCRISLSFTGWGNYSVDKIVRTQLTDIADQILRNLYNTGKISDSLTAADNAYSVSLDNLEPLSEFQSSKLIKHFDEISALTGEARYAKLMELGLLSNQYKLGDIENISGNDQSIIQAVKSAIHIDKLPNNATIDLLEERKTVTIKNGDWSVQTTKQDANQTSLLKSLVSNKHLYVKSTNPWTSGFEFGDTTVLDFSGKHVNDDGDWSIKDDELNMDYDESSDVLSNVHKLGAHTYRGILTDYPDGDPSEVTIYTK